MMRRLDRLRADAEYLVMSAETSGCIDRYERTTLAHG
jgi:hypothetical protein